MCVRGSVWRCWGMPGPRHTAPPVLSQLPSAVPALFPSPSLHPTFPSSLQLPFHLALIWYSPHHFSNSQQSKVPTFHSYSCTRKTKLMGACDRYCCNQTKYTAQCGVVCNTNQHIAKLFGQASRNTLKHDTAKMQITTTILNGCKYKNRQAGG